MIDFCVSEYNLSASEELRFRDINIIYNLDGLTAGQACYNKNTIRLNKQMLTKYPDELLNKTFPHEVAHFISFYIFNDNGHGKYWKRVMREFGLNPERTHSYKLEKKRKVKKTEVYCNCTAHKVTNIIIKRMNEGSKYRCKKCKNILTFNKEN